VKYASTTIPANSIWYVKNKMIHYRTFTQTNYGVLQMSNKTTINIAKMADVFTKRSGYSYESNLQLFEVFKSQSKRDKIPMAVNTFQAVGEEFWGIDVLPFPKDTPKNSSKALKDITDKDLYGITYPGQLKKVDVIDMSNNGTVEFNYIYKDNRDYWTSEVKVLKITGDDYWQYDENPLPPSGAGAAEFPVAKTDLVAQPKEFTDAYYNQDELKTTSLSSLSTTFAKADIVIAFNNKSGEELSYWWKNSKGEEYLYQILQNNQMYYQHTLCLLVY